MSRCSNAIRRAAIGAALAAGSVLSGCSDMYYDRRETLALGADDAVAANKVTQMIDPWPAQSGNRNIPGNGDRVAAAVERYRMNKVVKPVGLGTGTSYGTPQASPDAPSAAAPAAVK